MTEAESIKDPKERLFAGSANLFPQPAASTAKQAELPLAVRSGFEMTQHLVGRFECRPAVWRHK
jgi:hypothetical protein